MADRYGADVLANNPHKKPRSTEVPVEMGMVVEDAQTGYVGAVVRIEYGRMELEDRRGRRKPFPVGPEHDVRRGQGVIEQAARGNTGLDPPDPLLGEVLEPGDTPIDLRQLARERRRKVVPLDIEAVTVA